MNKIMTVKFHGAELYGIQLGNVVYVVLKPIVDAMGLDWEGQRQRIQRDPVLSEGTCIMKVPSVTGGPQDTLCLILDYVNGWLFRIQSARIRDPAIRERVQAYQRECYRVLYQHFSDDREKLVRESNEATVLNLQMVRETRHIWGARAAAQMWINRGLPRVSAMDELFRQGNLFDWADGAKAA
jgi:hypothetical protein